MIHWLKHFSWCLTGFALGSTIQPKTKGIWVWAFEHPNNPEHYLLLLDTEGLGDAFKVHTKQVVFTNNHIV